MKYSNEDLKLVATKFTNNKKIIVVSEYFKSLVSDMAKNAGMESPYISKYPYTAIWKINSNCNLRCKHCFFYGTKQYETKNDLSTEKIFEIIKQLANAGIIEIRLTGGEVFLRKDIFEIIEYIKKFNMVVNLATNGTTLSEKEVKKIAKLLNNKTDIIRVSLDGADAVTNDYTRGPGSFVKTIATIKLLVQHKINVLVNTTVTNKNIMQLPQLCKLSESLGVKQIILIKIFPISDSQNNLVPKFEELVIACAQMYREMSKYEKFLIDNKLFNASDFVHEKLSREIVVEEIKNKQLCNQEFKKFHCNEDKSFYIDASGFVYLCSLAADYKLFPLGNLKKESIEDIFATRDYNLLFQKRDLDKSACGICEINSFCRGGCFVLSYLKSKDINTPSGNC